MKNKYKDKFESFDATNEHFVEPNQEDDYLIIDRSKWRTGEYSKNQTGEGDTHLLNIEGYMCCLGFRCHQMGIPKKELLGVGSPFSLRENWEIPGLIDERGYNTIFTNTAIKINDSESLTIKQREKQIIAHFATENIIVEFIGKY